jgi:hypothetical protein
VNRLFKTLWFPVLLWFAVSLGYYYFFFAKAHVQLDIEVAERTWFKIYWANADQQFSEKRMARVRVSPGQRKYTFFSTDLRKVTQLRIDPHQYVGQVTLHSLVMSQKSVEDVVFNSADDFSKLKPHFFIQDYSYDDNGLIVTSSGMDPNFVYTFEPQTKAYSAVEEFIRYGVIGVFIFLLYWGLSPLIEELRFIPICLCVILALVMTMALISKENSHPDEFVHVPAAEYYTNHWAPPLIEDPGIIHTYSPYGSSRLNNDEIYYLFCGKFAEMLEPLKLTHYVQFRMFNVFLLTLILIYIFRYENSRILSLPVIVSPQVWYLFSYCNSDALALTVSFFIGCQVILKDSTFNRYLRSAGGIYWFLKAILVALCFGLLLLVKKNYLAYGLILAFIVAIDWYRYTDFSSRKVWGMRLVIVAIGAISIFGSKKVLDYQVNGPDKSAKVAAMERKMAIPIYNENTPLEQKHAFLNLKERGIPLRKLILDDRWFEKTFRSGVGVYSYFTISAPRIYYDLMRWSCVALFLFLYGTIFWKGGGWEKSIAVVVFLMSVALIGASLEHSWTDDFQTQGRYLFPMLSMLALLFGQNRDILNTRWLGLLVVIMFGVSFYSFSAVALASIPRF